MNCFNTFFAIAGSSNCVASKFKNLCCVFSYFFIILNE